MDDVIHWLSRLAIIVFFTGLLGCLIVIPRTAIALLLAALDKSDSDD